MASRWDFLYDLKPVPIVEQLLDEVAKLVAKDLGDWPLSLDAFASEADAARFRPLLAPGAPRPDPKVYAAAFKLARLELMREYEQIDDYMRNERWRADQVPPDAYDALVLLDRYLVELMLAVADSTHSRLSRAQLVDCLTRAERRTRSSALILEP